jgi:hypothetical protein
VEEAQDVNDMSWLDQDEDDGIPIKEVSLTFRKAAPQRPVDLDETEVSVMHTLANFILSHLALSDLKDLHMMHRRWLG